MNNNKHKTHSNIIDNNKFNVSKLFNIFLLCFQNNDELLIDFILFVRKFVDENDVSIFQKIENYEMYHKLTLKCGSLREYTEVYDDVNILHIVSYCLDTLLNMCINIDYKHKDVLLHDNQKILLNMTEKFTSDSYIFIQHYYRGIGGDESTFFIHDHIKIFSKFINYLLECKIIYTVRNNFANQKIYSINIHKIKSVYQLCVILCIMNEGPIVRVQREPINDVKIHTSTIGAGYICCFDYLKYKENVINFICDIKNCRIDTYRSSGAGGQHVNKTNSAIRITNNIIDIVSSSQDNRSQVENKKTALHRMKEQVICLYNKTIEDILDKNRNKTDRNYKNETMNMKRKQIVYSYMCVNNFLKTLNVNMNILDNIDYGINLLKLVLYNTIVQ